MQNLNDEYFSDLFSPLKNKNVFIADSTRNAIAQELKRQNFLSFNPKQFNVYYLGSFFIIGVIVVLSILSPKDSTPSATPVVKKETPTAKKIKPPKEGKVQLPKKKQKFEQIPKITGTPKLIEIPKPNIVYNTKLPTIPDSIISKPTKKVDAQKTAFVPVKKDTVYDKTSKDSTVKHTTQTVIDTAQTIKKETLPVKIEPQKETAENIINEVAPIENIEVSDDSAIKDKKRKRKKSKKD